MRKLNDWVPQVRAAARASLPSVTQNSPPDCVADSLFATLSHWSPWGRIGDMDRLTILNCLADSQVAHALKQRLILTTAGPATRVFSQTGRCDWLDPFLTEIATLSRQPALRAKAARCLLEHQSVWTEGMAWQWTDKVYGMGKLVPVLNTRPVAVREPFVCGLKRAIRDPSPMVRRVAGEMLIKNLANLDEDAVGLAELLACDPSKSVAERGRYALADLARQGPYSGS